jgi:hypothetical protein
VIAFRDDFQVTQSILASLLRCFQYDYQEVCLKVKASIGLELPLVDGEHAFASRSWWCLVAEALGSCSLSFTPIKGSSSCVVLFIKKHKNPAESTCCKVGPQSMKSVQVMQQIIAHVTGYQKQITSNRKCKEHNAHIISQFSSEVMLGLKHSGLRYQKKHN